MLYIVVAIVVLLLVLLALLPRITQLRESRHTPTGEAKPVSPSAYAPVAAIAAEQPSVRDRLGKTRGRLAGLVGALTGRHAIPAEFWDELEEGLLAADVGVSITDSVLANLRAVVKAGEITDTEQLSAAIRDDFKQRLHGFDRELHYADTKPTVWLFVGVNGVGKTTTIGKLALREHRAGKSVVMAAGDTFRAAAAEQLQVWADRSNADLVRGQEGGDPSAVIFDGVQRAASRHADLVLGDTAGRLHNKVNLMEELRKIRRVADREPGVVTEVLLVLDAVTGQNGLEQAKVFTEAVELTGVVLTKLDGSAKGGVVLAIHDQLGIPVKLVGLGETAEDLIAFDPDEFVDALLS